MTETVTSSNYSRIVIYDGVCNFCNGAVEFIIKRDPNALFLFAPMQSSFAQALISEYAPSTLGQDTFILIKFDRVYLWSDAALEVAKELKGAWWLFGIFKLVPHRVRDWFYRAFAKRRYVLFGKQLRCAVPSPENRERYIGV